MQNYFCGAAATLWKELYLIISTVVFLCNMVEVDALYRAVYLYCLFIYLFFMHFMVYLVRVIAGCRSIQRKSQRKYETVLTEDPFSCCCSKYLTKSTMKTECEYAWISDQYISTSRLFSISSTLYLTYSIFYSNMVAHEGVVSKSLTVLIHQVSWFVFCSHHLVVPVITHLSFPWFMQ